MITRLGFRPSLLPVSLSLVAASFAFSGAHCACAQTREDIFGESSEVSKGPATNAELVSDTPTIRPGQPFTVALHLTLPKGWHVYWRNPGDSGTSTHIKWELPVGFKTAEIQWPTPHRFVTGTLVSYGYSDEVWLLTQITPPTTLPVGQPISLAANADWLVCKDQCVPQKKLLGLTVNVADDAPPPDQTLSTQFATARAHLPAPSAKSGFAFRADKPAPIKAKLAQTSVNLRFTPPAKFPLGAEQLKTLYFYPADESTLSHPAIQKIVKEGNGYRLPLTASEDATTPLKRLRGVLVAPSKSAAPSDALAHGIWLDVPVTTTPAPKK